MLLDKKEISLPELTLIIYDLYKIGLYNEESLEESLSALYVTGTRTEKLLEELISISRVVNSEESLEESKPNVLGPIEELLEELIGPIDFNLIT